MYIYYGVLITMFFIVLELRLRERRMTANILFDLAAEDIELEFKNAGKQFYKKDGNITANALSKIEQKEDEYGAKLTRNKVFRKPIRRHIKWNRLRGKQLNKYLRKESDMKRLIKSKKFTPQNFQNARKKIKEDLPGVYVLYNSSRNMYYVGQAKHLYSRVNQHMTGHGNGDVYSDYKHGDSFSIKLCPIKYTPYKSLNRFEKDMIAYHNAYTMGYNKTAGNR